MVYYYGIIVFQSFCLIWLLCGKMTSLLHFLLLLLLLNCFIVVHTFFPLQGYSAVVQRNLLRLPLRSVAQESATQLQHVGFIVDGNGRWAQQRNLPRANGHSQGANVTFEIVKASFEASIPYISLYLFSTENWSRPNYEIQHIFELLNEYLVKYVNFFITHKIQVVTIGQIDKLPALSQRIVNEVVAKTASFATSTSGRKVLCLALSYGGRNDILTALESIASNPFTSTLPLTEELIERHLSLGRLDLPCPDLIIRTSGEKRLSNFFLWQAAYSELEFTDTYCKNC